MLSISIKFEYIDGEEEVICSKTCFNSSIEEWSLNSGSLRHEFKEFLRWCCIEWRGEVPVESFLKYVGKNKEEAIQIINNNYQDIQNDMLLEKRNRSLNNVFMHEFYELEKEKKLKSVYISLVDQS